MSPLIFMKSDRPLKTLIPSLLGSFPTSCALELPMGSAHCCCLSRESGRSDNRTQDKSLQSFFQISFRGHSGMTGKQHPAGRRLLFLMGQIQNYLSGKEFPPVSESSKLVCQAESHHHLQLRKQHKPCNLLSLSSDT